MMRAESMSLFDGLDKRKLGLRSGVNFEGRGS